MLHRPLKVFRKVCNGGAGRAAQAILGRNEPAVASCSLSKTGFSTKSGKGLSRKLFTPGPLIVSDRVKRAMLPDVGTRHADFIHIVKYVRNAILQVAQVSPDKYTVIPIQGSGTVAMESAIKTFFGLKEGKVLVLENGKYGKRIGEICQLAGVDFATLPMNLEQLQQCLGSYKTVAGVIAVHCETSSGIINNLSKIGDIVKRKNPEATFLVDASTTFGGVEIDMRHIDVLIGSSYRCLQGVPGVSCVIADKSLILKRRGKCPSMVLDLTAQYDSLEKTGQFRFTAPTHIMMALGEALLELHEEGGVSGRAKRYKENSLVLKKRMMEMGFSPLLNEFDHPQSYLVNAFHQPRNTRFVFDEFYQRLSDKGQVICPQTSTVPGCFSISTIGDLYPDDVRQLADCTRDVCGAMKIDLPISK